MQAYVRSGETGEAREWLDALDRGRNPAEIEGLRQLLAMETGEMAEAARLIRAQIANRQRGAGDLSPLRALLALGRLEDAEAETIAIKTAPGQSRKLASQFGVVHLGALVSELRLYEDHQRRRPGKAPPPELVRTHYFAAKEVTDAWQTVHPLGCPPRSGVDRAAAHRPVLEPDRGPGLDPGDHGELARGPGLARHALRPGLGPPLAARR